jgi:phage shock protein PspC (stress-responsive transcriptional regulator)
MKKAIKINLNGAIFHIDEDAYEKLKKYLDAISQHFSNKDEGDEIMNDIESRIAELFQEKITKEEEVVSMKMVTEVIEIMGDPKDIIDTDESQEAGSSRNSHRNHSGNNKRLFRDQENSVIGGVCSGLGAYFKIDALIIRILFVIFFLVGGSSLLIYIILWIVIPKAESAAQKLEMRGEPVNVSNIEKKVKEEYKAAKENVKAAANSESAKKTKKAANDFFSVLGKILLVFLKVILIIIGTSLVLSGIAVIVGLLTGTFMGLHFFPFGDYGFSLADLLAPFSDPVSISLLAISLVLLFVIPIFAMIYGLIKLIFSIKGHNRGLTIGTVSLWFVALLMSIGILAIETSNFSDSGTSKTNNNFTISSDTLYVYVNKEQKREFKKELTFNFDLDNQGEWYLTEDLERIYGRVDFDIEQADGDKIRVEIKKRSKGKNWDDADNRASKLNYNFRTTDNQITLDPFFYIENTDKWRFPRLDITLYVPEGKYIILDKETREILDDVYNVDHISDWRMGGKTWFMAKKGLTLVEE